MHHVALSVTVVLNCPRELSSLNIHKSYDFFFFFTFFTFFFFYKSKNFHVSSACLTLYEVTSVAKIQSTKPWQNDFLPVASDFKMAQFYQVIIHPISKIWVLLSSKINLNHQLGRNQILCWFHMKWINRCWLLPSFSIQDLLIFKIDERICSSTVELHASTVKRLKNPLNRQELANLMKKCCGTQTDEK